MHESRVCDTGFEIADARESTTPLPIWVSQKGMPVVCTNCEQQGFDKLQYGNRFPQEILKMFFRWNQCHRPGKLASRGPVALRTCRSILLVILRLAPAPRISSGCRADCRSGQQLHHLLR